MKKFSFYLAILSILALVIYSCAKEPNTTDEAFAKSQVIELRGNSSACSPQTLYTEYDGCDTITRDTIISFALGYGLYSTGSMLYNVCGDISVPVTYTFTTCKLNSFDAVVHFVHDLHYDLNALIAACPALKAQIIYHNLNGTIESFLGALDHDISSQVEFTEAYNETKDYWNRDDYLCSEPGHIFYSIKYIKNTCYKWVLKGIPSTGVGTTPGTGTGDGSFVISQEDCGSSVCCARSAEYCVHNYEANGEPNLIISTPRNYQKFEGSCPEECTHDCGGPKIGPMTPSSETQIEDGI